MKNTGNAFVSTPSFPLGTGPRPAGIIRLLDRPDARVFAAFAFACLLSIAAFPDVWASMVRVWSNSETFAHGFIALPCAAWMLWRRSDDWSLLPQRVFWPAAAAIVGCGLVWLVGRLGGVSSLEQIGAVALIPAMMLLLVGPAVTRSLSFPLAFLFFAVPIGEFLTPRMMDYTADATVAALRWTGIPVFREGLHFSLPTGRWSVVEACSGLRYLIASLALGVLYAYLQFRTLLYRLAFVALSIIVPIVANWVRAYGIVLLGHLSDMRIATGADHLIYGWIFFGFVMALLFWIGSRWREPEQASAGDGMRLSASASNLPGAPITASNARLLAGAALTIVAALIWRPLSAGMLDATEPIDAVTPLSAPLAAFPVADDLAFRPQYKDAAETFEATRLVQEAPVGVHAFYYARQHETREMIYSGHAVVRVDDFRWPIASKAAQRTPWGEVMAYRLGSSGSEQLLVWHWYAIGDTQTASEYRAKAATAWSLLTGRGDHSLAVVLVTPLQRDSAATRAEALRTATLRLQAVADAMQPAIRDVAHGGNSGAR